MQALFSPKQDNSRIFGAQELDSIQFSIQFNADISRLIVCQHRRSPVNGPGYCACSIVWLEAKDSVFQRSRRSYIDPFIHAQKVQSLWVLISLILLKAYQWLYDHQERLSSVVTGNDGWKWAQPLFTAHSISVPELLNANFHLESMIHLFCLLHGPFRQGALPRIKTPPSHRNSTVSYSIWLLSLLYYYLLYSSQHRLLDKLEKGTEASSCWSKHILTICRRRSVATSTNDRPIQHMQVLQYHSLAATLVRPKDHCSSQHSTRIAIEYVPSLSLTNIRRSRTSSSHD